MQHDAVPAAGAARVRPAGPDDRVRDAFPVASPTSTRPAPTPTPSRHPTATARPTVPSVPAGMPLAARVGQLLMVGVPAAGAGDAALRQLGRYRVGGVILTGRSRAGTAATAALTARVRAAVPGPAGADRDRPGGRRGAGVEGSRLPARCRARAARAG